MHTLQAPYRALFDSLLAYEGASLYADILAPWRDANSTERDFLRAFKNRRGEPIPRADTEELWRLYALSRISQLLLMCHQRGQYDGTSWPGPTLSIDEYARFADSLGLSIAALEPFTPLLHEIVEVEPAADRDQPIVLRDAIWPGLMLGDLVFSRAGVRVFGGGRFVVKEIAETSTLYWAYRRKNRPHRDPSHGWGGSSQWRTRFRRDYRIAGREYYNVEGKGDLARPNSNVEDRDDLTNAERIELLMNRCLLRSTKRNDDLWPYDDTYSVGGSPSPNRRGASR